MDIDSEENGLTTSDALRKLHLEIEGVLLQFRFSQKSKFVLDIAVFDYYR